jgi:hypothetical protein
MRDSAMLLAIDHDAGANFSILRRRSVYRVFRTAMMGMNAVCR